MQLARGGGGSGGVFWDLSPCPVGADANFRNTVSEFNGIIGHPAGVGRELENFSVWTNPHTLLGRAEILGAEWWAEAETEFFLFISTSQSG